MKMNRKTLVDKLKKIQPVTSGNPVLQGDCFLFRDGDAWVYSNELFMKMECPLCEGAVHAKTLMDLLGRIKSEEIEVSSGEGSLHIGWGRKSTAEIRIEKVTAPIREFQTPEKDMKDLHENFVENLKKVLVCAGKDDFQIDVARNSVHIDEGVIEASNGVCLFRTFFEGEMEELLLPASSIRMLVKFNPIGYCSQKKEGWSFFMDEESVVMGCRLLESEYPNMEKMMPEGGIGIQFDADASDCIKTALSVLENGDGQYIVDCSLNSGEITLSSKGPFGKVKESVNATCDEDSLEFSINPDFLMDALDLDGSIMLTDRMLLVDGEDFVYIACLYNRI